MKKILLFIAALFFCGMTQAQEYHWTYDYHQWDNVFPMIAVVHLNGEVLASGNYEVAAFVGDEVRGTEFLAEIDPSYYPGVYFAWYGISFTNNNETVTYKMYDHNTNIEYVDCSTTILTNQDGYGEMDDPLIIEFTAEEPIPYGPDYPWIVVGGFENYMYIEAQIQINGVPMENTNWEVGAFCGDECRGLGDADNWWVSPVDQSNILEIVVGGAAGDVINFYLYDVTNQEVFHGICNKTLDWVDGDIGDMFEPYVINFVTEQTFDKEIAGYTAGQIDHYYLLASPIGEVSPENVTNMLSNDYDLYYFDQEGDIDGKEWINYKGNDGNFNLEPGKGYLYANSQTVNLSFTGFPTYGEADVTLSRTDNTNVDFQGWNLVGNPLAQSAYIAKDFYKMNSYGTDIVSTTAETAIEAMEGIFVVADEDEEILTFSNEEPAKSPALLLNLSQNRGIVIDRAIVRFDEGNALPKLMLNENNTKVYIPQDNKDFAVIRTNENGETPIHFKAAKNGTYTISISTQEVDFRYLHLIDNLTGTDIDLLETPSYTFNAKTTDYASRFKLVFITGLSDDHFAFFSNGNWIIDNEGSATLQIIDVTGRIISSESINGCASVNIDEAAGVYMIRLIKGDNVKVQKIVVK